MSDGHISKHWKHHIKDKLNIAIDFYSLKHLNTDEVSATLSLNDALIMDGHENISTTKIYAINEETRAIKRVKKVANEF